MARQADHCQPFILFDIFQGRVIRAKGVFRFGRFHYLFRCSGQKRLCPPWPLSIHDRYNSSINHAFLKSMYKKRCRQTSTGRIFADFHIPGVSLEQLTMNPEKFVLGRSNFSEKCLLHFKKWNFTTRADLKTHATGCAGVLQNRFLLIIIEMNTADGTDTNTGSATGA